MASQTMTGTASVRAAADYLAAELPGCGISCELTDRCVHTVGDVRVETLVFEKYCMRSSNYASLTAVFCGSGDSVTVDLIGAGAREGVFSLTTWGTEERFVADAAEVLMRFGLQ